MGGALSGLEASLRSRLAVLDKYAHVLSEYNDNELHGAGSRTFRSVASMALGSQ